MKISREEAEQHLSAGRPVAFVPEGEQPARTLQVPEGGRRAVRAKLPGQDEPGEYVLLRDEKGNLTRAGMERVMSTGGTVLLDGKVIEHRDDLPTEEELARGDERRENLARQAIMDQMAALQGRLAQLDRPAEGGERSEAIVKGPQPQPQSSLPGTTQLASSDRPSPPGPRPRPRPPTGREVKPGEKEE